MEQFITPDRIANAIMQDKSFTGYYMIVEGKKDSKLFGRFISNQNVKIKEAFGNEKVKKVLQLLETRGFGNKLGIIDRDFKELMGTVENIDGLFITDYHDIEILIVNSSALESVLNVCCTKKAIEDFETNNGKTIKDLIFERGKEIGYLKLANKIYDLGLIFKPKSPEGNQVKYRDFICNRTLEFLGQKELVDSIINYSRNKSENLKERAEIDSSLKAICKNTYDLNQLVNGHDVSNILFILMKQVLKSKNKLVADYNSVEDSLILAYDYGEFQQSNLYQRIHAWANNLGIQIFK